MVKPVTPQVLPVVQPQTLSATAPSGPVLTAAPCCWCRVFNTDVNAHGSTYVLSTQHPNFNLSYKLKIDFIANQVVVSRILGWGSVDPGISQADKDAVQQALASAVPTFLSNNYKLKVTDPSCAPGFKELPIRFEISWSGTPSIRVNLLPGPSRSTASGTVMNLDTHDTQENNFTLTHELMHTFGQVDEYMYGSGTSASAEYHRADGTSVTITYPHTNPNLMSARSHNLEARLFWFVEIEAQKFLRSATGLGRTGVTCEVV
ncbi:MAG: hypothetical protein ABJN34_05135 [Litoreibacter sp.]|uniref:hypothetical protein n=1 Tax=Litoreibacter sp. TaxID=1969459 RepID=UPI00329A1EAF